MNKTRFFTFVALIVATVASLIVGTSFFTQSSLFAQTNTKLLVSAAASLKDSLQEIKPLYQNKQQVAMIAYNFAASGALQQQIENGAPVDIFISAAEKQMKALRSQGLILEDTQRNLLTNRLVLIVPNNSSNITNFKQLTSPEVKRIAVGEPRSVPAGQYAQEVFKKLKILEQVKPKLVLGNNVRQVLAFVESGNADAGIVYLTDAKTSKQVKVAVTAAEDLHSPIVYPVAVLKGSKNIPAAKEYVQFLSSRQAKTVFEKYGFGIAQ